MKVRLAHKTEKQSPIDTVFWAQYEHPRLEMNRTSQARNAFERSEVRETGAHTLMSWSPSNELKMANSILTF